MKFQIGDKVIPISKNVGTGNCPHFEKYKAGRVQFLVVTDIHDDYAVCTSNYRDNGKTFNQTGNYYLESDLVYYEPPTRDKLVGQLVRNEITEAQYRAMSSLLEGESHV